MVSLALTRAEKLDVACPPALEDVPEYPSGLRIVLTHRELPRLELEADCAVGDTLEFRAGSSASTAQRRRWGPRTASNCRSPT
jgi:hypothetical protein